MRILGVIAKFISPISTNIVVGHATTPFISAYSWTANGFGTKRADPATIPTFTPKSISFSPSGTDISVTHNGSPFVTIYPFNNGFGTKYANPATMLTNGSLIVHLIQQEP